MQLKRTASSEEELSVCGKSPTDCVARVSNVVILDPQSCPEIGKKVNED